jgi:hypothetical protein
MDYSDTILLASIQFCLVRFRYRNGYLWGLRRYEQQSIQIWNILCLPLRSKLQTQLYLYISLILGCKYTPIYLQASLKIEAITSSETFANYLATWTHIPQVYNLYSYCQWLLEKWWESPRVKSLTTGTYMCCCEQSNATPGSIASCDCLD